MNNYSLRMKCLIIATFILISLILETVKAQEITEEEVLTLLKTWDTSIKNKDTQTLDQVLHANYAYSGSSNGSITNKDGMLENLRNDKANYLPTEFNDLDIRYFDNVALLRGWEVINILEDSGDTLQIKLRFTDVYRKENGVLKAISTHSSPISEK